MCDTERKHSQVVSTAQKLHRTQQQLERVDSMRRQQARMLHAMAGQMDRSYQEEQSELARARQALADLQTENAKLMRRNSSGGDKCVQLLFSSLGISCISHDVSIIYTLRVYKMGFGMCIRHCGFCTGSRHIAWTCVCRCVHVR